MSQFYLPKAESEHVKAQHQHYLRDLVRADMEGSYHEAREEAELEPRHYCEHCGIRLQTPGAAICFHCGKKNG